MSNFLHHANDDDFEKEVINADKPVLVDFFADWCGPCKMLAPILEEIAEAYDNKVKVVKINVDQSPHVAQKYGIRGIPTLILFKNGNAEATKVGALTKSQLEAFINSNM